MASASNQTSIVANSQESLVFTPRLMPVEKHQLTLNIESNVDFDSLAFNSEEYDVKHYFVHQNWMKYFEILNGPTYGELVKHLWVRAEVFDEEAAELERQQHICEDKSKMGMTREQLGLPKFTHPYIQVNLLGMKVKISEAHIAKLLNLPCSGICKTKIKKQEFQTFLTEINQKLFDGKSSEKVCNLSNTHKLLLKIMNSSIFPRIGSKDQMSLDHKHFLYWLTEKLKINLPRYIFRNLCDAIKKGYKEELHIPHARLLSELIHQSRMIQNLEEMGGNEQYLETSL